METVILLLEIVIFALTLVVLFFAYNGKRRGKDLSDKIMDSLENDVEPEPEHLTVEGVMEVLGREGYAPERVDEDNVHFKREGVLYNVAYKSNRMDFTLGYGMGKLDGSAEHRIQSLCRQVSESIIMADAVLQGPDSDGCFTILFRISLILRCKDEFTSTVQDYIDILEEIHDRFCKEYYDKDAQGQEDEEDGDPAAMTIPAAPGKLPS